MELIDLTLDDILSECNKLHSKIIQNFNYDLVIFVAKGAYLIGKDLAELNDVPLLVVSAKRKGNKIKKLISPLLKFVPNKILIKLREKENNSSYHENNSERYVSFDEKIYSKFNEKKKILLVDDSIDTGNTIISVKESLEKYFYNSTIKIATINVMKKANIYPDYFLYENKLVRGPWSSDSKENYKYINLYYKWLEDYGKEK